MVVEREALKTVLRTAYSAEDSMDVTELRDALRAIIAGCKSVLSDEEYHIVHEGSKEQIVTYEQALALARELASYFESVEGGKCFQVLEQSGVIYINDQPFAEPID